MRFLMFLVLLVAIGIAGFGYYRGWFAVSANNSDQTPSVTVTVDKAKFHEDEQKAKDKIGDRDGKAKEPQRQP